MGYIWLVIVVLAFGDFSPPFVVSSLNPQPLPATLFIQLIHHTTHHIMDQVSTPNGPDTPISLLLSPAPSSASTLPLNSSINGATGVAVDVSPPITSRLHQTNTPSTLDSVIKHRRSELRRLQKIRAAKDEQTGGVHALIARGEDRTKPHSGSQPVSHTDTHARIVNITKIVTDPPSFTSQSAPPHRPPRSPCLPHPWRFSQHLLEHITVQQQQQRRPHALLCPFAEQVPQERPLCLSRFRPAFRPLRQRI